MKRRNLIFTLALVISGFAGGTQALAAPTVDPALTNRLATAQSTDLFGVILTFEGERITDAQVAAVTALGITGGFRMTNLPIMAVNATPAQITRMMNLGGLRSVYLNAPVELYLHQTRPLIGVDRLHKDADITRRNGGQPVSGRGITIAINDTGVDGTHQDLTYNTLNPVAGKTIQNVLVNMNDKDGLLARSDTLGNIFEGFIPPVYVENVVNTDTHGGHGTHVASTAAGTGAASGGLYAGVAPGASIVGLGSGAGLFIIGQIAAFDYCLTNQFLYNIRAVNNSWGNSATDQDPNHPINVASRRLHEHNIAVVFANGNDGPDPNSQNRWASWPWTINVGATMKDGRLAGFSSRGIFGDPNIHPTVVVPGTGGPAAQGYTSDVIAARSRFNPVANGADADLEIPPAFVANYTQISGTSMAAPHLAGIIANVLQANPSLLVDDLRAILERTATPLATYDEFEVGAGLANVHAAVDLAFNPSKPYGNFGVAGKGLALTQQSAPPISASVAANSSRDHTVSVPANARFSFIQLDWGGSAGEEEVVVDNTNVVINDLALTVFRNGQQVARSNATNLGGLFGAREGVKLEFPADGNYVVRVNAGLAGAGVIAEQPYTITVKHYTYDPNQVADAASLDPATRTGVYRLVYDRVMLTEGGYFRASATLTRIEMGRALMFAARVPQFLPNQPAFGDVPAGTPEQLIAESLRREGVMGLGGNTFGAHSAVTRLEEAVALVRALRMDAQAKALAGTTITSGGQALTDNAQIPSTLRGYVQLALDKGLLQAYPAEFREIAPGQYEVVPGPRFEPARQVTRAEFVAPVVKLLAEMFGE